jgi:hypothetical protein
MGSSKQERLIAISRMFSSSVLQELARKGRSPLFSNLFRLAHLSDSLARSSRVADAYDFAFKCLKQEGARDEYVYKSALFHKILVGRHSLQTASLLNEFRVGDCKADLAILNGTSTVYEVKSERDTLTRLGRQTRAYLSVFARVYVITAQSHINAVLNSTPEDVGVLYLNHRFQISVVREAVHAPERTSADAIFDSIRTEEARLILLSAGIAVPEVPNTERSAMLREHFVKLESHVAHEGMVAVLKKTRNSVRLADLILQLPPSLQTAAISVPLRKIDHSRLVAAVNTSLDDAMAWG